MSARIVAKALLWAVTAAVATAIVLVALGVSIPMIAALKGGGSGKAWAVWGFWTALQAVILVVCLQLPLVFLAGMIWIALIRRQPALDQTRKGFLLGCLIVSLPATMIASMPTSFVWPPNAAAYPDISTTVALLTLIVLCYLGVLLPRLIVPGLKQGQLIPPLDDTDPELAR